MKLVIFGLNHRTAPLEVRESWALSATESQEALHHLRDCPFPTPTPDGTQIPTEHLVLSTCNRTEFYGHVPLAFSPPGKKGGSPGTPTTVELYAHFYRQFYQKVQRSLGNGTKTLDPQHFYVHLQDDALEHLFRLASGLDSMILGECQILQQIKGAFTVAQDAQTVGTFFHRLFPAALRTAKRVRSVTAISEGAITPGQAALKLARKTLGDLSTRSILVVGSGKIAATTARAFRDEKLEQYFVINRTEERAQALVKKIGAGTPLAWDRLQETLARVDLVISSTGAVEPIVQKAMLAKIQKERQRPMVIVDLAIPRDFDPSVREIPQVSLFNIDDLNGVIQENVDGRHSHIPLAEKIIGEEVETFQRQMTFLQVDPVLRHMAERFEQIRLGELQAYISQFPPEYHPLLKQVTSSLVKKLLHFPIEKLKSLRDLKGLDSKEVAFLKHLFLTDV